MPQEPLTKLEEYLALMFGGLFALGFARIFQLAGSTGRTLADSTGQTKGAPPIIDIVLNHTFLIPLFCCIFTMACAVLSYAANKQFVTVTPNTGSGALAAWLCYFCIFSILVMYFFAISFENFRWWILTYSVLCVINLIWTLYAVTKSTRRTHIIANVTVPLLVGLFFLIAPKWWQEWRQDPKFIYVLLAIVILVKVWQRSRRANRVYRILYPGNP